jgi:hypothetical protein
MRIMRIHNYITYTSTRTHNLRKCEKNATAILLNLFNYNLIEF